MVSCDRSFQLFACKYIGGQLNKLCGEMDGARSALEVECVHQARVASRRLRTAFEIFQSCFPGKVVKKWRKEIKSLTKGLGDARDADVQILYLEGILADFHDDNRHLKPGIERLLLRTNQLRDSLQGGVIKTINKLESKAVLADIHSTIERMRFCLRNESGAVGSPFVFRTTGEKIRNKLEQLLGYERCLEDSEDKPSHHAMRIVAKGLRYSMEICSEPYEGKLDEYIKNVKKVQSFLGDIHDCDVWGEKIDDFAADELTRTREYFGIDGPYFLMQPGLEYLQKHYTEKRKATFEELVEYWGNLRDQNTWDNLKSALQEPLESKVQVKQEIIEIKEKATNDETSQINTVDGGYPFESAGSDGSVE